MGLTIMGTMVGGLVIVSLVTEMIRQHQLRGVPIRTETTSTKKQNGNSR